jgi:hypothetical protein
MKRRNVTNVALSMLLVFVFGAAQSLLGSPPATAAAALENKKLFTDAIRTELFFGCSRKNGPDITESEFQEFIDEFVTPRFPSGFTVIDGRGQWRENDGSITKERAKILIVVYKRNHRKTIGATLEEIRSEYKRRFQQSSVLRIDTRASADGL